MEDGGDVFGDCTGLEDGGAFNLLASGTYLR